MFKNARVRLLAILIVALTVSYVASLVVRAKSTDLGPVAKQDGSSASIAAPTTLSPGATSSIAQAAHTAPERATAKATATGLAAGVSTTDAGAKELASTGDAARDTQIRRVVESMEQTGKPPPGVAQGGNPPGNFRNLEGRLPRGRTYTESDIWPRERGGRGAERLIFNDTSAVWYTGDHYETMKRLR
jgi:guanyl-specific ribonuclease Sa